LKEQWINQLVKIGVLNINDLSSSTKIVIDAYFHQEIVVYHKHARGIFLTTDVQTWVDENLKEGCSIHRSTIASFLIELVFGNERDAALFKLFWF
jgi:hypothetical protein